MLTATPEQPVEDDIDTASDEDFNPDAAPQDEDSSSSEDEAAPTTSQARRSKGKRSRNDYDAINTELDSGDEATIQERRQSKRRKGGSDADFSSDDDGGDGGFVRTRAQRRNEQQERKPLVSAKGATIDVDAIWAKLSSQPVGRRMDPPKQVEQTKAPEEEYITIKRTTKFAGQVTTEERRVLKTSAEARLYLEEQEREKAAKAKKQQQQQQQQQQQEEEQANEEQREPQEPDANADTPTKPQLRRPLFRLSRFEPNPTGEVKGLPPHLQLKWWQHTRPGAPARVATRTETVAATSRPTVRPPAAAKLNVVDKSRHDWAGFVDQEGIAEELDEYGRSKQSYLSREDFLNRMEQRREVGRMEAKAKAA